METLKRCTLCEEIKCLDSYNRNKNKKDGRDSFCKKCCILKKNEHRRTIIGLLARIYSHQVFSRASRKFGKPTYSLEEFRGKYVNDKTFLSLYHNWKLNGYKRGLSPSFDRKDDYKGYSFGNLNKWMTWENNHKKGNADIRSGKLILGGIKKQRPVMQLKNGVKINEFVSAHDAARHTQAKQSCIVNVCKGRGKTAGGYSWKYKN